MTTTQLLKQRQKIRGANGVRTPYLDTVSDGMQDLYIALGKSRFIARFTSQKSNGDTILKVWLREGEKRNIVNNVAIKQMFKKLPATRFPKHFEGQCIEIIIPEQHD